ncbi:protein SPT2 homolog [Macrobrachium nipponense]|uniref:protein SPT2 homolog n=1 Tax=Macrobrachium nipponense TaxID=159736 RepID=UPI0030C88547
MDFSYLLELAKDNDKKNKHEAAVPKFSTKLSGPKKLQKTAPNVNAIKALLDKKDEDKAKAQEEFRKKRANLLALRAQDRKANARVSAMINRTKGANKSVLEDAKDLTTARGEEQCDEDDYGYESAMSQQIFSKLADQYAKMPEDDKLKFVKSGKKTSIDDIKNRVINSLKKEEEEEMEPRKRKRKSKFADDDFINDGDAFDDFDEPPWDKKTSSVLSSQKTVNINLTNYKSDKYTNFKYDSEKEKKKDEKDRDRDRDRDREKEKKKKKPKPAAPPPMSFVELMQMAKQKQSAPVQKLTVDNIIKEKEKEKKKEIDRPLTAKEKEELEDERRRKLRRLGKLPSEGKKEDNQDKTRKNGETDKGKKSEDKVKAKSESTSKLQQALEKPKPEPKAVDRSKYFAVPGPSMPPPKNPSVPVKNKPPPPSEQVSDRKFQKPRDFPPKDLKPVKSRDFPQKPKARDFPPDRRRPQHAPPPPKRGRIESDSEEEYDSEMDDFIDDGEEELDYSSEIKKMFGYDKSRYVDEDDCDDMEASYSQMQKEERISAKIGLQEDLEDMKREEEEKKMKMKKMKMMKSKGRR